MYNGYTLYWSSALAERTPKPGETSEECRKRIMKSCLEEWKQSNELRQVWSQKAKTANLQAKSELQARQSLVARERLQRSRSETQQGTSSSNSLVQLVERTVGMSGHSRDSDMLVEHLDDDLDDSRFHQIVGARSSSATKGSNLGPLGLGDSNWPVSESIIHEADREPGFVKSQALKWKQRSGTMIAQQEPFPAATLKLSCTEMYGFCVSTIQNMAVYRHVLTQLKQFVSNHRRSHLVGKRNHGPNVEIHHPLLVMKPNESLRVRLLWLLFLLRFGLVTFNLIIQRSTDESVRSLLCSLRLSDEGNGGVRAWVLCRAKFSPYEGDWWEFDCSRREGPFVYPWIGVPGIEQKGLLIYPRISTQTTLARDISNFLANNGAACLWTVVPYTVQASE